MSQSIVAKDAEITLIDTCRLQVNQEATDLRWDPVKKHPDIQLLNSVVTAKLRSNLSGAKGIIASKGFLIGTAAESLTYKLHQGTIIHVGFAEKTRNLASLQEAPDLVSTPITVTQDENLRMELSATKLTVTHEGKTVILDLTPHAGKTMYPWVSDAKTGGTGFSVSIIKTSRLSVYIAENGTVVFETSADGGVDRPIKFDTGSAPIEFTGGGLITDTVHDIVESTIGTPLTLREIGGADVKINASGDVTTPGDVTAAKVVASSVCAPAASSITLFENGGAGLTIANGTGVGTFSASVIAPAVVCDNVLATLGNDLNLVEQTSGLGLHVEDTTGDVTADAALTVTDGLAVGGTMNVTGSTVLGPVMTNSIKSNIKFDLSLTDNSGLGMHVADSTGVVTFDDHLVSKQVRSSSGNNLLLQNWGGEGITVSDAAGGAVTCATTLTVNNEIYGIAGLTLHNSIGSAKGIVIAPVTGDVSCSSDVSVNGDLTATGALEVDVSGRIGNTPLPVSAVFSMSSVGQDKAVLMPIVDLVASVTTPVLGMVVFQSSDSLFYGYTGSGWQKFSMGEHTIDT